MKPLVVAIVLLSALPAGARTGMQAKAPFASETHYTLCQWLTEQTHVGSCASKSAARAKTGALVADASISSPDSPAGKNSIPTWGQAVSVAEVLAGFDVPSTRTLNRLTFSVTWHITRVASVVRGLPTLAWVRPQLLVQPHGVDCRCSYAGDSIDLTPDLAGADVTATLTLDARSVKITKGLYTLQTGFLAQGGLQHSPGMARSLVTGWVKSISLRVN